MLSADFCTVTQAASLYRSVGILAASSRWMRAVSLSARIVGQVERRQQLRQFADVADHVSANQSTCLTWIS